MFTSLMAVTVHPMRVHHSLERFSAMPFAGIIPAKVIHGSEGSFLCKEYQNIELALALS